MHSPLFRNGLLDLLDFPKPLSSDVAQRLFPAIELRLANTLREKREAIEILRDELAANSKDYYEIVGEVDTLSQYQESTDAMLQLLRATVPETSSPSS